jgi:hypothetical protein
LVGAAVVQGRVDAVAEVVGLLVGQGSLEVAQDDPHQEVLLGRADAEAGDGLGREPVVGRLGQYGDLLDRVGVRVEGVADAVAEVLGVVAGVDGDREVAPARRAEGRSSGRRRGDRPSGAAGCRGCPCGA